MTGCLKGNFKQHALWLDALKGMLSNMPFDWMPRREMPFDRMPIYCTAMKERLSKTFWNTEIVITLLLRQNRAQKCLADISRFLPGSEALLNGCKLVDEMCFIPSRSNDPYTPLKNKQSQHGKQFWHLIYFKEWIHFWPQGTLTGTSLVWVLWVL